MNINELKNKTLFIYLDGKVYKLFLENNIVKIREKKPEESTTNQICLLLHQNRTNEIKSGYIINDKKNPMNENEIIKYAVNNLNLLDATGISLLNTEIKNGENTYNIIYYTTKFEIERLFLDFEFSEIYPFDFFLYTLDQTSELYGILAEDFYYIKQFNSILDLESIKKIEIGKGNLTNKTIAENLNTTKFKNMFINDGIEKIYNIHDNLNKPKTNENYIPFKENNNLDNENSIYSFPIANNLKELHIEDLLENLINFNNFKFQDKFSIFYKAKKIKPFLLILSVLFISLSTFFVYEFINTKTINYIYTKRINEYNNEISKIEKIKNEAIKNNFLSYYKPLNKEKLNEILKILKKMNLSFVDNYSLSIKNDIININIKTSSLKNVEIITKLNEENKNIQNLKINSKKNNDNFEISFSYSDKKIKNNSHSLKRRKK